MSGRGPRFAGRRWQSWLLGLGIFVALPDRGAAQSRWEFTPYFVGHFPLKAYNHLLGPSNETTGSFKQTSAPGVGGKLTYWFDPVLALEGDFNYVSSGTRVDFRGPPGGAEIFEDEGYQLDATGRLIIRPRHTTLRLGLGAGYIRRGGDAWRDELVQGGGKFHRNNLTTVVSAGAVPHLVKGLRLLVEVETLVYWVEKYQQGESGFSRRTWMQADLQLKMGIPVGL